MVANYVRRGKRLREHKSTSLGHVVYPFGDLVRIIPCDLVRSREDIGNENWDLLLSGAVAR